MRILLLALLALTGCSQSDKITNLYVHVPEKLAQELTVKCDDPPHAYVWYQLIEHNHFKCDTSSLFSGSHSCYGWTVHLKVKCSINGNEAILTEQYASAFGNSEVHEEQ